MRGLPPLVLALLLATGCAAPGAGGHAELADDYARRLARLEAQIEQAAGQRRAGDVSACRVIGVGAKPCGGPWRFLVYSAFDGDAARLEALVAEYNAVDRERNERLGLASTCDVTPEPTPEIVGGRCVARTL